MEKRALYTEILNFYAVKKNPNKCVERIRLHFQQTNFILYLHELDSKRLKY